MNCSSCSQMENERGQEIRTFFFSTHHGVCSLLTAGNLRRGAARAGCRQAPGSASRAARADPATWAGRGVPIPPHRAAVLVRLFCSRGSQRCRPYPLLHELRSDGEECVVAWWGRPGETGTAKQARLKSEPAGKGETCTEYIHAPLFPCHF